MKVLVVDDNKDVALTTAIMFETLGCETETEHVPQNVIDKISNTKPDLVVLDIGMPGLSGYDICRELRSRDGGEFIVAHTGWGKDEDKQKAWDAGFDDLLLKPASLEQYQAILGKVGKKE